MSQEYGPKWMELKRQALIRDNFTCQTCGKKGTRTRFRETDLEVHHIKPSESKENRYDILENLITLCNHCHKKLHPRFKRAG